MRLQLTTVSPVHIGNGEELEVSDYELQNGSYYRLNIDKAFKIIEDHNQFEKIIHLIEDKSRDLSKEKDNKKQAKLRQELNLLNLCKNVSKPLHDQLKSELKNISDYTFIDKLPKSQTKSGGKNSRKISVQLKTADRRLHTSFKPEGCDPNRTCCKCYSFSE